MDTSREDVGILIRSAFLAKGTKQRFSLLALVILSIVFIFIETIETKPLNYLRSFIKDTIYRGSQFVAVPFNSFDSISENISSHISLYENYNKLNKDEFINELNNNINNYDTYIKKNISPDGNKIGYKKIFKIIKEDLFSN